MKYVLLNLGFLFLLPVLTFAQKITYSENLKEDSRNMNFEIIGKLQGNILVFKNLGNNYRVAVYDNNMQLTEKVNLDFLPNRTFNVDFLAYPDFFYLFYQYTKKGTVYCNVAKLDAKAQLINQPIVLDTTNINIFQEDKIYTPVFSEDKQRIMILKVQKKMSDLHYNTLLYNHKLELIHKSLIITDFDERKVDYSDYLLANDGTLVYTKASKYRNNYNAASLYLVIKDSISDNFSYKKIELNKIYTDEIKIKIDNVNNKYLINSFYIPEKRGDIRGIFCAIWDAKADTVLANTYTPLDDTIRATAKLNGRMRDAFNDFYIRNILIKKDGSYLLTAENYVTQSNGIYNDRWNSLNSNFYTSPSDFYFNNRSYNSYYRPFNSFNNAQSKRFNYDNILVLNISQTGIPQWSSVINKEQYDVDTDNYLSFGVLNAGGEIHFLFNNSKTNDNLLYDHSLSATGLLKRNPSIKSTDKGYDFMPRFSKQVGAREIIIPCTFRTQICFAKIVF